MAPTYYLKLSQKSKGDERRRGILRNAFFSDLALEYFLCLLKSIGICLSEILRRQILDIKFMAFHVDLMFCLFNFFYERSFHWFCHCAGLILQSFQLFLKSLLIRDNTNIFLTRFLSLIKFIKTQDLCCPWAGHRRWWLNQYEAQAAQTDDTKAPIKTPTLPAQQINRENLTQQQGFGVSQHFTLCGCSDFDLRPLMLDLLWNHVKSWAQEEQMNKWGQSSQHLRDSCW